MAIGVDATLNELQSHALALGIFDRVNRHEPKTAPGNGMTAAFWAGAIRPVARASGLAITSALATCLGRVYTSVTSEAPDHIDPMMTSAVDLLMTAYMADFTLGGNADHIDLLGIHGVALNAEAGYIGYDDGSTTMRVYTITIPVVYHDVWTQSP